jgi:hypothetical protein
MDKKLKERLDEIEKKLDEILDRLPPKTYAATYPYSRTDWDEWDYVATPVVYPPVGGTAVETDYGNEPDP